MRAAVSNVNFISIEGGLILWIVCTAALQFESAAVVDIQEMSRLGSDD